MVPQLIVVRIKFEEKGQQRSFIEQVLKNINCISLRELINRGFDIPYSTLKNYYSEQRLLPEVFFNDLCYIGKIKKDFFKVELLDENWGKIKGGKKGKKD
ncbi:MAG: hypothetical protein AABX88_02105 [Nanoarchaeota archaeon]